MDYVGNNATLPLTSVFQRGTGPTYCKLTYVND